jgi:hypothetical protein
VCLAKGVKGNVNYTYAILMQTIHIIFLFVLQKIRPTSAIENEVTTLRERWWNPNVQSIFIPTSYYLNCYVVQGWCTSWSLMPNGLSLLMHQRATNTKHSQFFLYALQPENKPSSYGEFSFKKTYFYHYIFVCYKTQHTIFNTIHRTFNNVRSISLNATPFYILEALAEKASVGVQKTLEQTCQVMIYVRVLIFHLVHLVPQQYGCRVFRYLMTIYWLLGSHTITMNVRIKWVGMWGKWQYLLWTCMQMLSLVRIATIYSTNPFSMFEF